MSTNYQEALKWYQKAADQGYIETQLILEYYMQMERVYPKIISKLQNGTKKQQIKAIHKGQTLLGFLYLQGKGVQRDYQQALKWFQKVVSKAIVVVCLRWVICIKMV